MLLYHFSYFKTMHKMTMICQRNITYSYHMHMNPPPQVSISGSLCKGISHYGYVYTPIVICMCETLATLSYTFKLSLK